MCALSTESPMTYSVNKYMYTGSNSYSFDWGGEETEKTQFPFSVASAFQNGNTTWEDVWSFPYMYTGSSSYSFDCGGGGEERKKPNFPLVLHQPSKRGTLHEKMLGLFRYFLPAPLKKLLFPPLADMLSWAVSFKFLLNKVIANTCLFILTSFSKQSASRKVLEICELCALSTDSRKTYSVNKYMYTGTGSYGFDGGGGGETEKTQFTFSVALAFQNRNATWKDVGSFPLFPPSPTEKIIVPPPLADMLSWAVSFKFLLIKVIANTCLFILTSFSKQSASREVLEICELCALSTDSRKTYSVNKYMYTGTGSYGFDWGGKKRKRPNLPFLLHQPSKMETLHEKMLGLFRYFLPAPLRKLLFPP